MMRKVAQILLAIVVCLNFVPHADADNPTNFVLNAAVGEGKFELAENKGKIVVLHFLLKTECPLCLKYTHDYGVLAANSKDAVHVFIKPDATKEIENWFSHINSKGLSKSIAIYQDPDAKLATDFGIPGGYRFHGETVHYPATIIINGEGKEVFRYVGKSNSDRLSIEDFKKQLKSIR